MLHTALESHDSHVTVFWQWSGAWDVAGLQCLCVEQGTCPRGLEEARAQKGSWLHVCQGSVSLPSTGSVFGPRGHGVSWSRDSREMLCQPERDTGTRQAWSCICERLGRSCICDGAGGKVVVRGGKGSLHLLEGGDGAGWGGLNAHSAGVQGDKHSFQQRTAFHDTLGFQESCTRLRRVFLAVLPFPLCLGSPKLSLVLWHHAGNCMDVCIWGSFQALLLTAAFCLWVC